VAPTGGKNSFYKNSNAMPATGANFKAEWITSEYFFFNYFFFPSPFTSTLVAFIVMNAL
jgi:hypothetical protein